MTMRDPDPHTPLDHERNSTAGWLIGAIVALLIVGALAFMWSSDWMNTAGNTGGTAGNTSAPASTTGSAAGTSGSADTSSGRTNAPPAGSSNR